MHVRLLSINLQVLDIYFRGFYPYEKKCNVCCMFFLHLSPWGESCYFTPIFSAKILPTNYVSPRLPFVMFILQKILTNFAHYYGKIQLLAINHLWKACFMLYAICTLCRVHIFCLFHLFHIFFLAHQILSWHAWNLVRPKNCSLRSVLRCNNSYYDLKVFSDCWASCLQENNNWAEIISCFTLRTLPFKMFGPFW